MEVTENYTKYIIRLILFADLYYEISNACRIRDERYIKREFITLI